jgi:anti-sigma B factor antagonist
MTFFIVSPQIISVEHRLVTIAVYGFFDARTKDIRMNLISNAHGDDVLIVVDAGRIDASVAIQFKDRMRELTDASDGRVILDMQNVEFLDSSGLGAVVAAMKQLGQGRKLELAELTATVLKVLQLTFMDKVFVIHDSVGSALGRDASAA